MAYEKTYDLLDLAIWMQSTREGISLNDISEKYQVSRRTYERYAFYQFLLSSG